MFAVGLDPATVRSISGFLHQLAAKASPRLILALRPQDSVPDWVTHVMILGNSNQILLQGSRQKVDKALDVWRNLSTLKRKKPAMSPSDTKIFNKAKEDMAKGILDRQLLWDLKLISHKPLKLAWSALPEGEPLIEMDGVRVQYGDNAVLGDWKQVVNGEEKEGLHWRLRRGQRWVVLGPNGSGKTTLLSLITSDHPQAYALPMKLFGRSRLPEPGKPAISLFELQSRMGHSSPEIHAFFPRQLSIRQAVESAFAETFLSKPKLNHERDLDISAALRFFKAELDPDAAVTTKEDPPKISGGGSKDMFPSIGKVKSHAYIPTDYDVEYADNTTFGQLNTAQQRIVLFIRALIHKPDIVILDEPFSSLPASTRDKCIHFLEAGEHGRNRVSTATRRTTSEDHWLKGFNSDPSSIRLHGLSDNQALIIISHAKEEIPDTVRFYMRLPSSDPGDGTVPLDFRFGTLKHGVVMSDSETWDVAWSPPSEFAKHARKSRRRKNAPGAAERMGDEDFYEWHSI